MTPSPSEIDWKARAKRAEDELRAREAFTASEAPLSSEELGDHYAWAVGELTRRKAYSKAEIAVLIAEQRARAEALEAALRKGVAFATEYANHQLEANDEAIAAFKDITHPDRRASLHGHRVARDIANFLAEAEDCAALSTPTAPTAAPGRAAISGHARDIIVGLAGEYIGGGMRCRLCWAQATLWSDVEHKASCALATAPTLTETLEKVRSVLPADYGPATAALIQEGTAERVSDGWRTMESAPRDGTHVLGHHPAYGVASMFWQVITTGLPYADEAAVVRGWRMHGMLVEPSHCDQPTHWRPLPARPAAEGERTP